jgi:hypothetical protein
VAAPDTLNSQAELEAAISAEKLRQLLPGAGNKLADPDRVLLALRSGTGAILGKIQIALDVTAIDTWWDAATTNERDKAEVKRLALSASIYYAHFYGLKAEEMPQTISDEMQRAETRATEIAEHHATLGAKTQPTASTQHDFVWNDGITESPLGSPRARWKGF